MSIPDAMDAVVIHSTGSPDVLEFERIAVPQLGTSEVLLRVDSIGVNPFDTKVRSGMFAPATLPAVIGSDVAGVVVASDLPDFNVGDVVCGFARSGAYAEYATAALPELVRVPDHVPLDQAAGLPVPGVIAWQALFDAGGLRDEQVAVIAGSAGGVGHIAVQLAKHAGATVVGTAAARDSAFVESLGADSVVDYARTNVADVVQADMVLDCVGGRNTVELCRAVRPGGRVVSLGAPLPPDFEAPTGINVLRPNRHADVRVLAELVQLVSSGDLRVCVGETLQLDEARRAHEQIEAGRATGKIILKP